MRSAMSVMAGNAARNCATACVREAQRGFMPIQMPTGTQITAAHGHLSFYGAYVALIG